MDGPEHENGVTLDLDAEEQWVLHTALLEHLDRHAEGNSPEAEAIELLERLEGGETLVVGREQLETVKDVLSEYLAGAPLRDRAVCRSVLSEVRDGL